MRFWLKTARLLILVGGVAVGASYLTWRFVKKRYAPPAAVKVRRERIVRGTLSETVSAPGVIQPRKNVKISAKITARIVEIPVEEGDKVTAGNPTAQPPVPASVLVRLDDRDLRSRLRAAKANRAAMAAQLQVEGATLKAQEADLAGLQAALHEAERDFKRKQALLQTHDVAQAVFDQAERRRAEEDARTQGARMRLAAARYNLEVLQHRIEAADADIEQAEEAIGYTVIKAPIAGTVTAINAEEGEMVVTGTMNNPGTVIMEVADLGTMILVAEVDEADVGKVAPGQTAVIHVQAYPDTDISGTVDTVALTHRMSKRGTRYYRTEICLGTSPVRLYSGLTANVDIRTRTHKDVLIVPSQAVLGRKVDELPEDIRAATPLVDREKTYATVVYRYIDGKAVVTPVRIGPADMTRTIILDGLTEADAVIAGPYKALAGLKHDSVVTVETGAAPGASAGTQK